jgi:hypothetical protein
MEVEVFASDLNTTEQKHAYIVGSPQGKAALLAKENGLIISELINSKQSDIILIDHYNEFKEKENIILDMVNQGATAVFIELDPGEYTIGDSIVEVKVCGMLPVHFVSRDTEHPLVKDFQPDDFRLWYDPEVDYITPLLETTFTADDFKEVLTSGNIDASKKWAKALAVAEKEFGNGQLIICQIKLAGRCKNNPIAQRFTSRMLHLK